MIWRKRPRWAACLTRNDTVIKVADIKDLDATVQGVLELAGHADLNIRFLNQEAKSESLEHKLDIAKKDLDSVTESIQKLVNAARKIIDASPPPVNGLIVDLKHACDEVESR